MTTENEPTSNMGSGTASSSTNKNERSSRVRTTTRLEYNQDVRKSIFIFEFILNSCITIFLLQIVQKNTKRRYAVPDKTGSNSISGPPKKKSKKGGKSGEATRNEASATQAESGPSCPLVYTGETRVVPPLRKSGKVDVFDNLNINEYVLMKMLEGTDLPEAPPSHK